MLTYNLSNDNLALYDSLYRHIREDILLGRIKPNEKLPSKRALAAHLGVSVVTVENAYAQLVSEGYLAAKERSGFYAEKVVKQSKVTFQGNAIVPENNKTKTEPKNSEKIALTREETDEPFPFSVWAKLMRKTLLEEGENLLRREDNAGALCLREAISRYLYRSMGIEAKPENIIICAGTENVCSILVQLFGRESVFGVEDPGYQKTSLLYESNFVPCRFLPLDKSGISVSALRESDVNIVHLSPAHHFPTGIVMPISRRQELLSWAGEKEDRYLIEDDYDSEFRFFGRPVPPLQTFDEKGKVVTINTFSKSLAPSIRVSYMLLPDKLMARYQEKLGFTACPVPAFEQFTLAKFIDGEYYERHLSRKRTYYRKKRKEIFETAERLSSKEKITLISAHCGAHALVKLSTTLSDDKILSQAKERGVTLTFLSEYSRLKEKKYEHILLLDYSSFRIEMLTILDEIL